MRVRADNETNGVPDWLTAYLLIGQLQILENKPNHALIHCWHAKWDYSFWNLALTILALVSHFLAKTPLANQTNSCPT